MFSNVEITAWSPDPGPRALLPWNSEHSTGDLPDLSSQARKSRIIPESANFSPSEDECERCPEPPCSGAGRSCRVCVSNGCGEHPNTPFVTLGCFLPSRESECGDFLLNFLKGDFVSLGFVMFDHQG